MARLATSVWFPLGLSLALLVPWLTHPDGSRAAQFTFIYALLIATDAKTWWDAAWVSTFLYEGQEPEIDWWEITKGAYDAPAFFIRLIALVGLSALTAAAVSVNHPALWTIVLVASATYLAGTLASYRNDIAAYMRRTDARLRSRPTTGAAEFDTGNPEDGV